MTKKNVLLSTIEKAILVFSLLLLFTSLKSHAQLNPSLLFRDGAVLQRDVELPIWGTADTGAVISVSLNGISATSTTNTEGKWKVILPVLDAGGPYEMTISSDENTITYTDIYIGDVWLASGQSNMEYTLSAADGGAAEAASANFETIRQFKVPKRTNDELQTTVPSGSSWRPAKGSNNTGNFSAVAYYFAKTIHAETGIPIGIINTSYGGSRIEAWMSDEMLGFDEEVVLAGGSYRERLPTVIYNTMLHPLSNFPIKGFIWYQGESNADSMEDALEYGSLFKTMINGWRKLWDMGNLPFLWVQLPGFGEVYESPQTWDSWPQLRQNQSRALELPATGEAVTIDLGDIDIHPTNKQPVGERLAKVGLKVAYNQDLVYSGPRYKNHTVRADGTIEIEFDQLGSGLSVESTLQGFATETNGSLSWTSAKVEDNKVIVTPSVNHPEVVRYAWEYNPAMANLYNTEELPAAPFRFYVDEPGFQIKQFIASTTILERGSFSVLTWETHGTNAVTLNNVTVDPIAGLRVVPTTTTKYTLKIVSGEEILSQEITLEVVDPKPTISIRTDVGGIADPETEITIIAAAIPPKGGNIEKVSFFVDGNLIESRTAEPYEITWTTPAEVGDYELTGVVTDNQGYKITSSPVILSVTKMKMLIYEAEDASHTGTGSVKKSPSCNGEHYLDLQSGWVLTFDNVEAPEAGTYPLSIRYLLNYEGPKGQKLIVNGTNLGEIMFEAPDKSTWMTYMQDVELNKGTNTIEIAESWGWMSFDYIAIAVEDTSSVSSKKIGDNAIEMKSYPNPFSTETQLTYKLNKKQQVNIQLFNTNSQLVKTIISGTKEAGSHSVIIEGKELEKGLYIAKLTTSEHIHTSRLMLFR